MTKTEEIKIDLELQQLLPPLSEEEYSKLEENILGQGVLNPLLVWQSSQGEYVLVDGHNRYNICATHKIKYETKLIEFASINEVKRWMIDHQLGKRNLTEAQKRQLIGEKYNSLKQDKTKNLVQGSILGEGKAKEELTTMLQGKDNTAQQLAKEYKTSESNVKRAGKLAETLNDLGKVNPKVKEIALKENLKPKQIYNLTKEEVKPKDLKQIEDASDLYQLIRKAKDSDKYRGRDQEAKLIAKDAKYVEALDILCGSDQELKWKILDKELDINNYTVIELAKSIKKREQKGGRTDQQKDKHDYKLLFENVSKSYDRLEKANTERYKQLKEVRKENENLKEEIKALENKSASRYKELREERNKSDELEQALESLESMKAKESDGTSFKFQTYDRLKICQLGLKIIRVNLDHSIIEQFNKEQLSFIELEKLSSNNKAKKRAKELTKTPDVICEDYAYKKG